MSPKDCIIHTFVYDSYYLQVDSVRTHVNIGVTSHPYTCYEESLYRLYENPVEQIEI